MYVCMIFLSLFQYDTKQLLVPAVTAKTDEVSNLSFGMQDNHTGMQD